MNITFSEKNKKILKYSFFNLVLILALVVNLIFLPRVLGLNFWLTELLVSFLPYLIWVQILLFILVFWLVFNFKKSPLTPLMKGGIGKVVMLKIFPVFVLILTVTSTIFGGFLIADFVLKSESKRTLESKENSRELRVAFLNKYKKNNKFEPIAKKVEELNPDIFTLAEFLEHEEAETKLSALLKEKYPYKYATDCNEILELDEEYCKQNFGGWGIYSKHPFEVQKYQYGSRFIEANVFLEDEKIKLFVVHTTAPIKSEYFDFRNEQIAKLSKKLNGLSDEDKIVILGDFNLTPWSLTYQDFLEKNEGKIYPAYRSQEINSDKLFFTWNLNFGFPSAHIDHIFVSENIQSKKFNVEKTTLGSDHLLIWSDLRV
jgi:endonuclease/exonuclease/phosphatase (EEP) superfamily protein YafD